MIYIIAFKNRELVGDRDAVLEVASLLERGKVPFKIGMRGANLNQEDLGCGSYQYWLKRDESFS